MTRSLKQVMHPRPRLRTLAGLVFVAALVAATLLPGASASIGAGPDGSCGITTLQATLVAGADGTLHCGPGEHLAVRTDLAAARPGRDAVRDPILSFLSLADLQVVDEESPLRSEFADSCPNTETTAQFRPQETMIPQLVNAHVKAASALAQSSTGSPDTHANYSFAVQLGSAVDNQQYDEARWFIDLLDGGKLVNPDSGKDGYEGVQSQDPRGGTPALTPPVPGMSLRDLANEPFWASGLRTGGGVPLPWFTIAGNHDIKVQGTVPDDSAAWRTFARAYVTGQFKFSDLGPGYQQEACRNPSLLSNPTFWTAVAGNPGASKVVTADPNRRLLDRAEWIKEHFISTGQPGGHGFDRDRCRTVSGALLARACYSWNQDPIHFIALDTSASEGASDGNIDQGQFDWLQRDLIANSSEYFDASGKKKTTRNANRMVVIFSHHTTATLTNPLAPAGSTSGVKSHGGADLEALLLRFPNVILHANGYTHENHVWAHHNNTNHTAYWEVNTASVVDWPSQSRSIEIADNHDGTLSIFGVLFDAAAAPNPRDVSWGQDDPTNEKRLGAARAINENWLASAAREIAYNDPQARHGADAIGGAGDRNVELLLPNPFGVTAHGVIVPRRPVLPPGITPPTNGVVFPHFGPDPQSIPKCVTFGCLPVQPPPQNPAGDQFAQPVYGTGPGLAVKPGGGGGLGSRAALYLLAAGAGTYWLLQARVRRWMIGI